SWRTFAICLSVYTLCRPSQPGSTAIDIGANIGATSIVLARAVGPRGQVFPFEPAPHKIVHLRSNLAANALTWATIVPFALSDRKADIPMHFPEGRARDSSALAKRCCRSFTKVAWSTRAHVCSATTVARPTRGLGGRYWCGARVPSPGARGEPTGVSA